MQLPPLAVFCTAVTQRRSNFITQRKLFRYFKKQQQQKTTKKTPAVYVRNFTLWMISHKFLFLIDRFVQRVLESRLLLQHQVLCLWTAHRQATVTKTIWYDFVAGEPRNIISGTELTAGVLKKRSKTHERLNGTPFKQTSLVHTSFWKNPTDSS